MLQLSCNPCSQEFGTCSGLSGGYCHEALHREQPRDFAWPGQGVVGVDVAFVMHLFQLSLQLWMSFILHYLPISFNSHLLDGWWMMIGCWFIPGTEWLVMVGVMFQQRHGRHVAQQKIEAASWTPSFLNGRCGKFTINPSKQLWKQAPGWALRAGPQNIGHPWASCSAMLVMPGCLSTMCAYNLVNGALARLESHQWALVNWGLPSCLEMWEGRGHILCASLRSIKYEVALHIPEEDLYAHASCRSCTASPAKPLAQEFTPAKMVILDWILQGLQTLERERHGETSRTISRCGPKATPQTCTGFVLFGLPIRRERVWKGHQVSHLCECASCHAQLYDVEKDSQNIAANASRSQSNRTNPFCGWFLYVCIDLK